MFFTIKSKRNIQLTKHRALFNAKRTILLFPKTAAEINLDRYLLEKLKMDLKQTCLWLLVNAKLSIVNSNEIIITFKTNEQDSIASLITYGNEKLSGSNILKYAFGRD